MCRASVRALFLDMDSGWQNYITLTGENAMASASVSYALTSPASSVLLPEGETMAGSSHDPKPYGKKVSELIWHVSA